MTKPGSIPNLLDGIKYYMALKNGDYDFALKCRKAMLEQNLNAYEARQGYDWITQDKKDEHKARIEKIKDEVTRLETKDVDYFHRLIEENEAYSLSKLKGII
jgi:hypothetical protein